VHHTTNNELRDEGEKMVSQRTYIIRSFSVVFSILLYGVLSLAYAQQTIFNIPTTDVLEKGKLYVELDASLKPTDGTLITKFSSFVPRFVVGAGSLVEIGLNITGNIQLGPDFFLFFP
jgi:hypothetical protein